MFLFATRIPVDAPGRCPLIGFEWRLLATTCVTFAYGSVLQPADHGELAPATVAEKFTRTDRLLLRNELSHLPTPALGLLSSVVPDAFASVALTLELSYLFHFFFCNALSFLITYAAFRLRCFFGPGAPVAFAALEVSLLSHNGSLQCL